MASFKLSSLHAAAFSAPPPPRSLPHDTGETPAKVREDLEKSLTELNNLSLSICNSEVSGDASHPRLTSVLPCTVDLA